MFRDVGGENDLPPDDLGEGRALLLDRQAPVQRQDRQIHCAAQGLQIVRRGGFPPRPGRNTSTSPFESDPADNVFHGGRARAARCKLH